MKDINERIAALQEIAAETLKKEDDYLSENGFRWHKSLKAVASSALEIISELQKENETLKSNNKKLCDASSAVDALNQLLNRS